MNERNLSTRSKTLLLQGLTALFAMLCWNTLWANAAPITIGVVPQFRSVEIRERWAPIAKEIEAATGRKAVIKYSKDIPSFEKQFQAGEFDIIYANPYHMVVANQTQGYLPIIHDHSKQLTGILVVRKDSGITEMSQLDNQPMAFPAPNALGASLLMRTELATEHKLTIKPRYVKTHSNVYLAVLAGQVKAGGGVMRTLRQMTERQQADLEVFYTTQKVNPHPIAVHPRVSAPIASQIQQALLAKPALLKDVPMAQPGASTFADYAKLSTMGLEKFAE
ncbi:MAG: phosphate/phosphite/phosphonate ABC transporter substrate-binding protein [Gammaproteobacteria bacterium]|nr:phosphate/phosphite/phosphonate ABC transporter substrate-binding protein [Gammaproteobacteria bacterium]